MENSDSHRAVLTSDLYEIASPSPVPATRTRTREVPVGTSSSRLDKIGFIGHSYGGRMALWTPAFDNRIRVSVSNCGCIDYKNSLTRDTGIQIEFCIPGFMQSHDIEDVIAEFKDCPLLIFAGTDDKWSRGSDELLKKVKAKGNGAVELQAYPGGHQFTPEMRERAYAFLESRLSH